MGKQKYRKQFKMSDRYGDDLSSYEWSIIGQHGAVHVHIARYGYQEEIRYNGGIEFHYRQPTEDYMQGLPPSHDECWLLKQPCWHDGSSLYVEESILPFIEHALRGDGLQNMHHDYVFGVMEKRANDIWMKE